ncbi:hypothetical protein C8Q79DRAFT_1005858 [Trametes meyenii]|nr:hypothetical protein C8Q79DRAFT_1005858 [Trametes meyenii]
MAPTTHPEIGEIVKEHLKLDQRNWRGYLRTCDLGHAHTLNASLGKTTFTTIGQIFEICMAKDREKPCALHCKPLEAQMTDQTRLKMFEALAKLLLERRRDTALSWNRTLSSPSVRNGQPPAGLSGRSRSGSLPSMGASNVVRTPVGRPVNPSCEVTAYIYVSGKHNPVTVVAKGTPRDRVVEFVFGQPKIYEAIGVDPASRHKPTYEMWHDWLRTWSIYPKPHQAVFLAPGESVLYREQSIAALPNLDHYIAKLKPPPTIERQALVKVRDILIPEPLSAPTRRLIGPAREPCTPTPSQRQASTTTSSASQYASRRTSLGAGSASSSFPDSPRMLTSVEVAAASLENHDASSKRARPHKRPLVVPTGEAIELSDEEDVRPKRRRHALPSGPVIDLTDDETTTGEPRKEVVGTRRATKALGKGKAVEVIELSSDDEDMSL